VVENQELMMAMKAMMSDYLPLLVWLLLPFLLLLLLEVVGCCSPRAEAVGCT
jgi:hypothetical protein